MAEGGVQCFSEEETTIELKKEESTGVHQELALPSPIPLQEPNQIPAPRPRTRHVARPANAEGVLAIHL